MTSDLVFGINFLKKWWRKAPQSAFLGDAGFSSILTGYSDVKIASIGKIARLNSGPVQDLVIGDALKKYPNGRAPSTSEWNGFFIDRAGDINYSGLAVEAVADSGKTLAKVGAGLLGGWVLWIAIGAGVMILASVKKSVHA